MFIRPEALRIAAGDDDRNRFECNFVTEEFEGNMRHIVLDASGRKLKMSMINDGRNPIDGSAPIALDFAPEMGIALPPGPLASA